MSILRVFRTEVAGAWRSLRYDLGRRSAPVDPPADGYPEVTSMGMSTFGGPATGLTGGVPVALGGTDPHDRPPRRMVAAAAIGLLALAGAAGSYLAVVNGLGALAADDPVAHEPLPVVAEPSPSATRVLGRPVRTDATPPTPGRVGTAADRPATAPTLAPTTAGRAGRTPARPRPVPPPAPSPTCACPTSPTPTPTSPSRPSGSPGSASPTPSPSPSASGSPSVDSSQPPSESRGY